MVQRLTISVSDEDHAWLKDHPEIKLSGLVQKCIKDLRERYRD